MFHVNLFLFSNSISFCRNDHGHVNQTLTSQKAFQLLSIHFQMPSPFQNHEEKSVSYLSKKPLRFFEGNFQIRMIASTNQPTTHPKPHLRNPASSQRGGELPRPLEFFLREKLLGEKNISSPKGWLPNLYRWIFPKNTMKLGEVW